MMRLVAGFVIGLLVGVGSIYLLDLPSHIHHSPYAGQHDRQISSLSASDIEQLERGAGWGFAKPAELNAYPGPMHVLELAEELELTAEQVAVVEAAFNSMKERATELGPRFIDAEHKLDQAFRNHTITPELIAAKAKNAALLRAELRSVHLMAHLEITPVLSDAQRLRYAELRGYNNSHANHGGH